MFGKSLLSDPNDVLVSWRAEKSGASFAFVVKPSGKSSIYTKMNERPRIEPCETAALMFDLDEHWPLRTTLLSIDLEMNVLTLSISTDTWMF